MDNDDEDDDINGKNSLYGGLLSMRVVLSTSSFLILTHLILSTILQYIYCYHHPLCIKKRTLRFSETKQFAQDSFSVVALGFEPRLSETKVWHLITKPCNLPLEIDLEINMGEESIQMEGTVFQRYNDIFRLARFFVSRVRTGQVEGNRIALLEEGRKDMLIALTRALNL